MTDTTVNTGETKRDTEMVDKTPTTGEVKKDIEMMIDRKIINEGVRKDSEMDMMTGKTTATGEVRKDTGMEIDMRIATEGVKRDTEMMIDKTTTAGEIKREMVREDREVPRTITTNFQDQRRTPRISIRVTTPLQ